MNKVQFIVTLNLGFCMFCVCVSVCVCVCVCVVLVVIDLVVTAPTQLIDWQYSMSFFAKLPVMR